MPKSDKYGPTYWDDKWPKAPIIYGGRTLLDGTKVGIDVRDFILDNDAIMQHIIKNNGLADKSLNKTAWNCQKFVCNNLKYVYDEESSGCPEFWQFPFETVQMEKMIGDCEDGAILIASLLVNAGAPPYRVKVAAGYVQEAPTAPLGGHGYCIYLADRPESSKGLEWVVLDWCYFEDSRTRVENKPLAKNNAYYKEIWFSFNNEHSWNQSAFEIGAGRVSKRQTTMIEQVGHNSTEYLARIADRFKQ